MTLRLISILGELEYGDVVMLGKVYKAEKKAKSDSAHEFFQEYGIPEDLNGGAKTEMLKAFAMFGTKELSEASKLIYHLEVLKNHRLVWFLENKYILSWNRLQEINESSDKVHWNVKNNDYTKTPVITELGLDFIRLVLSEDELDSGDIDTK